MFVFVNYVFNYNNQIMNPIKKISKNVKSLLSASNQINSFTKAVQELVYNSLDANATSIAVRVHIEEGYIQIVDNGCGINKNDFKVLGHSHMTSKVTDISTLKSMPNTYGYRGQALASIVQVSKCVKITSRSNQSEDTFIKVFEYGKEKEIVGTKTRPSVGTTVEVKGFLYNLSIQNKCTNNITNLEEIKSFLQHTSLVQYNISMSLRDDSTNEIVFKIHKKRDIYQTLSSLYAIQKSDVQELQVEKNQYKVTAFIGKGNNDTLKHLVFLNGKLITGFSKVHNIVSRNLSKYLKMDKAERKKYKEIFDKEEEIINPEIPYYLIFLKCPYNDYDLSSTSKYTTVDFKDWSEISKLLEKLIKFYVGDITIQKTDTTPNINKRNTKHNHSDTKNQVKQIIDRILGSKPKMPKVSQMHNGVKGKQARRKAKKARKEFLSSKSKTSNFLQNRNDLISSNDHSKPRNNVLNSSTDLNIEPNNELDNTSVPVNKESTDPAQKPSVTTNAFDNKLKKLNYKKSPILKSNQGKNRSKETVIPKIKNTKVPVKTTSLLSKFIDPTESLKQRVNTFIQIPNGINNKINVVENKQSKEVLIEETVEYENATGNRTTSVRKKLNEIIVRDIFPIPDNFKIFNTKSYQNNKEKGSLLSTYDILNTILNSQSKEAFKERDNNLKKRYVKSIKSINNDMPHSHNNQTYHGSPVITFQSHNYFENGNIGINYLSHGNQNDVFSPIQEDIGNVFKKPRAFLSKKSIENFGPNGNRTNLFKRTSYKKNNWLKKTLKKAFNERHYKQNNLQDMHRSEKSSSYTIQYSESDNYNLTKYSLNNNEYDPSLSSFTMNIEQPTSAYTLNHTPQLIDFSNNQIISNYLFDSEDFLRTVNKDFNIAAVMSTRMNQNIDLFYERVINNGTYTIRNTSYNDIEQSFSNIRNFDEPVIHTTYIVDRKNNTVDEDRNTITSDDELNVADKFLSSKSQNEQISDPIQVCEAIMDSNELLNNEFENSFNVRNDSLNIYVNNDNYNNADNLETNINSNDKNEDTNLEQISHHFAVTQIPKTIANEIEKEIHIEKHNEVRDENSKVRDENVVESDNAFNFNIEDRLCFLPKGMSQIFKYCNSKAIIRNQNCVEDYYEDRIYNEFANKVQNTVEIFEPKIQEASDLVSKDINKVNNKLKKDMASLKFDGDSLKNAKVLGQVDQKFISVVIKGDDESRFESEFLVLFDQHAVHERIRLEANLSDYLTDGQWKSLTLDEVTLKLTSDEIKFLHNYKDKFAQFGLQWSILNNTEISLAAIPEAVLGKNARPVDKIIRAVQSLIKEIINTIKLQSGCVSVYPKAIMDLVFSEACRYAIKFGDRLSKSQCIELLKNLSECRTPFQCAHGRPVMAVLMDIRPTDFSYKICLENIKKFKKVT